MKFLCVECDEQMTFTERQLPGDGTLAAVFTCGSCDRSVGMLTNPMETQLVSSLGVKVGGRGVPEQPMEMTRGALEGGREDAFRGEELPEAEAPGPAGPRSEEGEAAPPPAEEETSSPARAVTWSEEAVERLERAPRFVRGMVRRIYDDYAKERGIDRITPAIMDRARSDLGLEGM